MTILDPRLPADDVVLDADAEAFLADYVREVNLTLAGHWHPETVPCSVKCPMGDPRTAALFRRTLDLAVTLGHRPRP